MHGFFSSPLFAALVGGFLSHVGVWIGARIGQPKTAVGQAALALGQAVLPGQVIKVEHYITSHAGEVAPVANAVVDAVAGAIVQPGPAPAAAPTRPLVGDQLPPVKEPAGL